MVNIQYSGGYFDVEDGIVGLLSTQEILHMEEVTTISNVTLDTFTKLLNTFNGNITHIDISQSNPYGALGYITINGERVKFVWYKNVLVVNSIKHKDTLIKLIKKFSIKPPEKDVAIYIKYPIETPFGIITRNFTIHKKEISKKINPDIFKFSKDQKGRPFNPYNIGKNWKQGNLLILHGEPGTGKSKSIVWLSFGLKEALKVPTLYTHIITPQTIDNLGDLVMDAISYQDYFYLFVLDDFDKLGGKFVRGAGNKVIDGVISLLLQATDGIIPIENIRLVITSNREITEIDPALLRPGRLYRRIELSCTTYYDITHNTINLPPDVISEYENYFDTSFNPHKKLTLAEWNFLVERVPELLELVK